MIQILVVDDDDINNFLLEHLLKKSSYAVKMNVLTSPVEAVEYIKRRFSDKNNIDLLLLDINMPLMTGWEVLDELRVNGISLLNNNKVYMLSSSVQCTDKEKASGYAEVSGFISKPITLDLLTTIFDEIRDAIEKGS